MRKFNKSEIHKLTCIRCGNVFLVAKNRINTAKYCSVLCKSESLKGIRVKQDHEYKISKSAQGYMFKIVHGHHRANKQGRVKIADIVLEAKLGRKLLKNEIAHHINHIRDDDSPENLEVMDKKTHDSLTLSERWIVWRKNGYAKVFSERSSIKQAEVWEKRRQQSYGNKTIHSKSTSYR